MKQILRDYLAQSGLFLEGTERVDIDRPLNVYAGINVTKTYNEPIDQLQIFIAAKRIQEWNMNEFGESGLFIPFIAGQYEVLNAMTSEEASDIIIRNKNKEEQKKRLFTSLAQQFGINTRILTTTDVWMDQRYWTFLLSLLGSGDFTRGTLIQDTLSFYETKEQLFKALRVKALPPSIVKLPVPFLKQIGNWPAPLLYTPCEVAEALYFQQTAGIQCKIGQAQERVYDKYLVNKLSTFRLRQPVNLLSTAQTPYPVTPYIDKTKEKASSRIFFNDSIEEVQQKIASVPPVSYVFTTDQEFGEVLNPLVEKAIFAVEAARTLGQPILFGTLTVSTGQELIGAVLQNKLSVSTIKQALPDLLTQYVLIKGRSL